MFPFAFALFLFSVQLFRDAVFICVEGVSAIEVVTDVVTDNWRFLELRLSILVSLIVLIVRDAGVLFLFGTWIIFTVAVAVADPSTVKTSSLTAVVIRLARFVSSLGITVLSSQPLAVSDTMWGDSFGGGRGCDGSR